MASESVPNRRLRDLYSLFSDDKTRDASAQFLRTEGLCGPKAGERLRCIREKQGFKAAEVAELAGLEPAELARLETSPTEADLSALATVCRVLGVSLAELSNQSVKFVDGDDILAAGSRVERSRREKKKP